MDTQRPAQLVWDLVNAHSYVIYTTLLAQAEWEMQQVIPTPSPLSLVEATVA